MSASPWFLYIIKMANNALYTGITTDLARRFAEHSAQSSKTAKALRGKAPLKLVYSCKLEGHSCALKAELWVKKQSKANKLKLISQAISMPFEHEYLASRPTENS
jgi:putative endonuclease